jgi:hypothetical protein
VVRVTDPYDRILGFLDWMQLCLHFERFKAALLLVTLKDLTFVLKSLEPFRYAATTYDLTTTDSLQYFIDSYWRFAHFKQDLAFIHSSIV